MRKTLSMLLIIMTAFGIASLTTNEIGETDLIINICSLVSICSIGILKELLKKYTYILLSFQIIIIIISLSFGFYGVEYILPIVMFELLGTKLEISSYMILSVCSGLLLTKGSYFNSIFYNVLITLYMYEVKKHYYFNEELKEFNKGERDEKFIIQKRLNNLERYIDQNNLLVTLKERNYMAQKLHDHLGHRITSSIMQLEVTKETLGKDNETSMKYLTSAMDNLRTGMDEIRAVLRNIKPKDTILGIEEIKETVLKFEYDTEIKVSLNIQGDTERVNLSIWNIILDNIKEGLTNVAKYSEATEVKIGIYIYNKFLRVEIRDDGKGCRKIEKGLGLQGIEERILALGGRVEFYVDSGFVINMIINLRE